ncbi:MAG: TIGR00269 family protein [Halobacteria archaeon]
MALCSRCPAPAVFFQRASGRHHCREHLLEDVERRVKRALRTAGLRPGERVAVGLSGGKDSASALFLLRTLRPRVGLVAITVDEGIAGYRSETLKAAEALTARLGVEHRVVRFSEAFGTTTDSAVAGGDGHPCSACGVFRRTLLNRTARESGAARLATGHNLDDEAQTILLNLLRGDSERTLRQNSSANLPGALPRLKPLRWVPEREVALYAMLRDLPVSFAECPHSGRSFRAEVRESLNSIEARHPGTKYAVVRGFEGLLTRLRPPEGAPAVACRVCGEASARGVCEACRILEGEPPKVTPT